MTKAPLGPQEASPSAGEIGEPTHLGNGGSAVLSPSIDAATGFGSSVQLDFPLWLFTGAAILAACFPVLLAFNLSPSPTFLNQAAACVGWGGFAALLALEGLNRRPWRGLESLLFAFGLLVLLAWHSMRAGSLPSSLSLSAIGMLLGAMALALSGAAARNAAAPERLFAGFCWGWVVAGCLSALVGVVQVFFPDWADGELIARSGLAGRAVGNLRQPNHLSSVLVWALAALIGLVEITRLRRAVAVAIAALLVFGVVLSASRTGMVGVGLLALWGVADRRLSRFSRWLLLAMPLMYLLSWSVMALWAHRWNHTFGAEARLSEPDVSGSRFRIWANTLDLIRQQPLRGVGFGEFNFAWTLTPFPNRPTAFFDHTHNLVLQLAVEVGVPLTLLVLGLLAHALWRAWSWGWAMPGAEGAALRCAFVMVLLVLLHSELEYPLWYAYFLLPAAWAFGYAASQPAVRSSAGAPGAGVVIFAAGLAVAVGGVMSCLDYTRVVEIFEPSSDALPLPQRIAIGQRSVLFSHHADYAAATMSEKPSEEMKALAGATHYLLDTRLMMTWAKALADRGDLDQARYLAQRLREFRKPETDEFFAPCKEAGSKPKPFQCEVPKTAITWRDFAHPLRPDGRPLKGAQRGLQGAP